MAEKEDLDLDAEKPAGSKKMIIIMVLAALVLVGASVGITIMLVGGDKAEEATAEVVEEKPTKPLYMPLEKVTVNLQQKGPARFLQVEMQLMSFDQATLDAVTEHMPVIRNDILVLLASQPFETLSTLEGKEQLRQQILDKIHVALKEQAGMEEPGLQAVYFTSFIMQ